ncbi:hypothetical protein [Streptomyces sp. NPDC059909]|uniref:hypothetical protein n=1 Tax=Streptomyces sp. NPDC059909 TaxID=3346998 RepID=UPI00365601EC
MSIRHTTKARRGATAVVMAAALALTVAGCGGDDPKESGSDSSSSAPTGNGGSNGDTAAGDRVDPNAKLAELRGAGDVLLTVNSVKRESGGFVTVTGVIKNEGSASKNPSAWAGIEIDVVSKNPNSVAGATLVDLAGKKRYYVLRDTDGRCLCTAGLTPVQPGKSVPVFMQFPAPPDSTTEVDLTLPTFSTAKLKISG